MPSAKAASRWSRGYQPQRLLSGDRHDRDEEERERYGAGHGAEPSHGHHDQPVSYDPGDDGRQTGHDLGQETGGATERLSPYSLM
jgi:hypothetical protein